MAGTKSALRTARIAVIALSVLLVAGSAGSWIFASKTLATTRAQIVVDAGKITDSSIATIVDGADLAVPVTTGRANAIDTALQESSFGSTGFESVTIWRTDGQVVYSSIQKLLAARLPTEASHLRAVLRDGTSSQIKDGMFQVFVPFTANGTDAVIEFDRPDAAIRATATPLKLASGMLALLFFATLYVLVRLSKAISSASANQAFRPTQTPGLGQVSQAAPEAPARGRKADQTPYTQAGYREESEARRRAEERTKALEDQISMLQDQYRNSLTELQNTQKKLQESVTTGGARGDKALEERLLKAEGRARLLEGQLTATAAERDKLATQVTEAREDVARAGAPDPNVERKLQQMQQESLALRAELEGTRTELDVAKRELATNQSRAKNLEAELSGLQNVVSDAEGQRVELRQAVAETDLLRGELEGLRTGAEEADVLRGQLDQLREQLEQLIPKAEAARTLRGELDEASAAREGAERAVEALREELSTATAALDALEAESRTLRDEAESVKSEHGASVAELDLARAKIDTMSEELAAAQAGVETLGSELEAAREATQAIQHEAERSAAAHAAAIEAKERELADLIDANRVELHAELEAIEADLRTKLDLTSTELSGQLEDAQQETAAAQARALEATAALEQLRIEFEEAGRRVAEAQAARDEVERQSQMHLEELERARTEAEVLQDQAEEHRAAAEARSGELDAVREQLRATIDELEALSAAKSGDENALAHAQADAQAVRRELDVALQQLEASALEIELARNGSADDVAAAQQEAAEGRAALEAALAELELARSQMGGAQEEVSGWQRRLAELEVELEGARSEMETTRSELEAARAELTDAQAEVQMELTRSVELAGRAEQVEQELAMLRDQQIAAAAGAGNDELEEVARLAQERLASQTDKLTQTEDRAHEAEEELRAALGRLSELEEALRQAAEAGAMAVPAMAAIDAGEPLEDRRAATPFMKELSLDAKKTLTQILGITLTLKHKKSAQEQAPFLRQLSAMAKRLDRTVSDLAEADKLARGDIELNIRRTNLEALVERVVEESGVAGEHEIRIETEELVVGVDPIRTEQILNGLLRSSADRTSPGSQITVRLQHEDDGALLSVEDKEASSDGSLSPVVTRLADVMGGWAKVESRTNGGSAFRVYLPDQSGGGAKSSPSHSADGEGKLQITVESPSVEEDVEREPVDFSEAGDDDPWAAGQLLVQELQRLSHQEGK